METWIDVNNPECMESICSTDFLRWQGISQASDDMYDPIRSMIDTLGISDEEILLNGW